VEKVGAAASPSGFLALALISNPSSQAAADVKVDIASVSASGRVLAHTTGTIALIDPLSHQALAVRLAATTPLPQRFTATLAANRWLEAGASADPEQVVDASFSQDPRTPAVRVRIANHRDTPQRALVTAICLDDAGTLRGGGTGSVTVAASAPGQDAWIPVSIPVTPTSCQGFALPE
jgi:hypothetical protein